MSVNFNTSGFLQPIKADGSSVFKNKSTIPVQIVFTNCNGSTPADLAPTIEVSLVSGSAPSGPEISGVMRFSSGQYVYNLTAKSLSDPFATYLITVTVPSNGQTISVPFALRP